MKEHYTVPASVTPLIATQYESVQASYDKLKAEGKLLPVAGTLSSAYENYEPSGKTARQKHPKTIFGKIFEGTIDYIWFNKSALSITSVLEMPTLAQVRSENFLPSKRFPSDHLRIEAVFALK